MLLKASDKFGYILLFFCLFINKTVITWTTQVELRTYDGDEEHVKTTVLCCCIQARISAVYNSYCSALFQF